MAPWTTRYPLVGQRRGRYTSRGSQQMDFARGVAELAASIEEYRPCRLSARFSLHTNELVIAIDHAWATGAPYTMTTTFDPIHPMPWAK